MPEAFTKLSLAAVDDAAPGTDLATVGKHGLRATPWLLSVPVWVTSKSGSSSPVSLVRSHAPRITCRSSESVPTKRWSNASGVKSGLSRTSVQTPSASVIA